MKRLLIFSLFLAFNNNHNFAQGIKDSLPKDSVDISRRTDASNNGFSGYGCKISYDDFNKGAVVTPMQLIQSKVPGFVVNCLNLNDPNPELQIQLRGISTLFLSTNPLYIIDGIPMESPDIIPVENIESIEVLKNLSETAPYGIRGSNGVVLIKTKNNKTKLLTVSYNTYIYGEAYAKKSSYMSASEWRKLKLDWASSPYFQLPGRSANMHDYNADTDWRKEISQNKLSQAHHLEFLGGYKKTSYSAMLNYNHYNGIIQKTDNANYGGQLSLSQFALKDKLQVDISVMGTCKKYSEINDNPFLNATDSYTGLKNPSIVTVANRFNPTIPVYNADGTYGIDTTYFTDNPVNRLNSIKDKRELRNTLVHVQASYEIVKGLKLSASWSEYKTATENSFSNDFKNTAANRYLNERKETNDQKEKLYAVKLNYNKTIDFHQVDISLNYSIQNTNIQYNYNYSVIETDTQLINRYWEIRTGNYDIKNLSGAINYNYKRKYYLSLCILKETSPFYSQDGSAQYFPSLSAAWSLKKEKFLTNIPWINELKLKAGYGVGQRMITFDNISSFGSVFTRSPNLHGEKMQEGNAGIDLSLLSNRLCFSFDYYNRKTKDGIEISVMPPSYVGPSFISNKTDIQNKGWEFYMKGLPLINRLKWTFDFNMSFNKNTVLSDLYKPGINYKGQAADNLIGRQFAGYSATNELLEYDDNGNITNYGKANVRILGNGAPKSFFGFTNTFGYKNFDLSIFVRGALGFEIANTVKLDEYKKILQFVDQRDIVNYSSLEHTDYIIEKGDYIKIATISLGYTIPINKRFMKSANVYIGCNNVALLTKATDIDPEKAGITGINPGYYYYEKYPETRLFLLGVKIVL